MVAPDTKGAGIGRSMGERAFYEACRLAFGAMQFNFVVPTNEPAMRLWQASAPHRQAVRRVSRLQIASEHGQRSPGSWSFWRLTIGVHCDEQVRRRATRLSGRRRKTVCRLRRTI